MSGIQATATLDASSGNTSSAGSAAASTPVSPAASTPSGGVIGVSVGMTQDTRQFVVKLFSVAIVLFSGAILAVLLYRAFVDGNAPLTQQITAGLIGMLPYLLGFLAVIIVGEPVGTALVARALQLFLGITSSAANLPPTSTPTSNNPPTPSA